MQNVSVQRKRNPGDTDKNGIISEYREIWANGDDYEGEWKNNMADGEGTLRTADGTKYKGHFVKGKEDGKGVLEDKNGVRYDGFFKQGKKHGAFVETDKNGNVIRKGVYKFGTLDAEQK